MFGIKRQTNNSVKESEHEWIEINQQHGSSVLSFRTDLDTNSTHVADILLGLKYWIFQKRKNIWIFSLSKSSSRKNMERIPSQFYLHEGCDFFSPTFLFFSTRFKSYFGLNLHAMCLYGSFQKQWILSANTFGNKNCDTKQNKTIQKQTNKHKGMAIQWVEDSNCFLVWGE